MRSNSCSRAYVGNGIGIALIAVLNQVGVVISNEVVVVVWLPASPTKSVVIGSIKESSLVSPAQEAAPFHGSLCQSPSRHIRERLLKSLP